MTDFLAKKIHTKKKKGSANNGNLFELKDIFANKVLISSIDIKNLHNFFPFSYLINGKERLRDDIESVMKGEFSVSADCKCYANWQYINILTN